MDFDNISDVGVAFVEAFSKSSLLENRYAEYLSDKLRQFNRTREVRVLVDQLTSYETRQKVLGYLRNEFPDTDDETFSAALQSIAIEISKKQAGRGQLCSDDKKGDRQREGGQASNSRRRPVRYRSLLTRRGSTRGQHSEYPV